MFLSRDAGKTPILIDFITSELVMSCARGPADIRWRPWTATVEYSRTVPISEEARSHVLWSAVSALWQGRRGFSLRFFSFVACLAQFSQSRIHLRETSRRVAISVISCPFFRDITTKSPGVSRSRGHERRTTDRRNGEKCICVCEQVYVCVLLSRGIGHDRRRGKRRRCASPSIRTTLLCVWPNNSMSLC